MYSSPSKIAKNNLIPSYELQQQPFDYERYSDMENALDQEGIIEFIKLRIL